MSKWKYQRLQRLLYWTLVASIALCGVLFAVWVWPKSKALPQDSQSQYIGHYRGFGLGYNFGCLTWLLGHSYYAITYPPTIPEDGLTTIGAMPGYNYFWGYYPNGTLREEGESLVEYLNPFPELPGGSYHIGWAKYYSPDGILGSEITDGSGTQTYWAANRIKVWELVLCNQSPVQLLTWHRNGQLATTCQYKNGFFHGALTRFYPDGSKKVEGTYDRGEKVGRWTRYNKDGSIISSKGKRNKGVGSVPVQRDLGRGGEGGRGTRTDFGKIGNVSD